MCILTAHVNSHATSCMERTLSNKTNNDMEMTIALASTLDVWLPLFSFDGSFFQKFYVKRRHENDLRFEFCKMRHRIRSFLALRLSVRRLQILLEGLRFLKTHWQHLELFTQHEPHIFAFLTQVTHYLTAVKA